MFSGHIFNWLGSNLLHRISISVHRHMLNDEEGQFYRYISLVMSYKSYHVSINICSIS